MSGQNPEEYMCGSLIELKQEKPGPTKSSRKNSPLGSRIQDYLFVCFGGK